MDIVELLVAAIALAAALGVVASFRSSIASVNGQLGALDGVEGIYFDDAPDHARRRSVDRRAGVRWLGTIRRVH